MSMITAFASNAANMALLTTTKTSGAGEVVAFDLDFVLRVGFHIISILLLFFIIGKILFNPIREVLKKRREGIESDFKSIEDGKKEVASLKQTYEHKLANIKAEADEILSTTHKKALEQQKEIIAEARVEADTIINRAKLEIKREQEKARDELKQEVIQIATLMASKFITSSMDPATQVKLLDESINEIGDNVWKD